MSLFSTLLAFIGTIWLSRWVLNTSRFVYTYLRSSSLKRYHHQSANGAPPWSVITGASDGIGKGYAHELARQDFNLILHGRNKSKLNDVAASIKTTYPDIKIRLVLSDACKYGCESLHEIKNIVESIQDLHVTILINNVGTGTRPTGHVFSNFEHDNPTDIDAIINTNARFPVQFTRALLPVLLSHSQPALILTMASISDIGSPYLSVYSATKAFVKSFSQALTREFAAEGSNIEVLAINTANVTETATEKSKTNFIKPIAGDFAREALRRVGCGYDVVEGYWSHALLQAVTTRLPNKFFSAILRDSIREEMKKEGKKA